jgi:hypothetical protein
MPVNNPHSVDRAYKFIYKMLGIIFHWYLYFEGEEIEFIETEIADTGQRRDVMVKVDGERIQITEFMAKALDDKKLKAIGDYHLSALVDPEYKNFAVNTGVFSIAEPTRGMDTVNLDKNLTFHVDVKFAKSKNAWKVLSTLVYKSVIQEELTYMEAVDLLVLPDMYMGRGENMELPIRIFMKIVIDLMGNVNYPSPDLKEKIFLREKKVLARFFAGEELSEMSDMLKSVSKNPEIARKIEEYGPGYDGIYLDGRFDGKLDVARKLLVMEVDEQIISESTGIPIVELEKIKKEL